MTRPQRILLSMVAISIVVMVLVPPFVMKARGMVQNLGYSFIGDPPLSAYDTPGTVNVELLCLQVVAALLVGGIMFLGFS
jgi:hypothetical protein